MRSAARDLQRQHAHVLATRQVPDESKAPRVSAAAEGAAPATHVLGLGRKRDGLICVPPGYSQDVPAPMMVLLHGAGADAGTIIPAVRRDTDAAGVLLLAPESRGRTWDAVLGRPGPDIDFLNAAVKSVVSRFAVNTDVVALAGFSDGASYALSLGVANGGLFQHIMAFSPGFMTPLGKHGRPRIFMAHGVDDPVLPIDVCSRPLRAQLLAAGYDVTYREFSEGHIIPPGVAAEALRWWLT
jgi:phospholipase/carboxylesterase